MWIIATIFYFIVTLIMFYVVVPYRFYAKFNKNREAMWDALEDHQTVSDEDYDIISQAINDNDERMNIDGLGFFGYAKLFNKSTVFSFYEELDGGGFISVILLSISYKIFYENNGSVITLDNRNDKPYGV